MTVKEAILILRANVVLACERAGFCSATVKMVEDALDTIDDALKEPEPSPKGCTYYEAKNRKPCCTHECDGCVWYV